MGNKEMKVKEVNKASFPSLSFSFLVSTQLALQTQDAGIIIDRHHIMDDIGTDPSLITCNLYKIILVKYNIKHQAF